MPQVLTQVSTVPQTLAQVSEVTKMVGLVAGRLWAAWTFHKLQKVRSAELEVQNSSLEQEQRRVQMLRQQPQLGIQLNVAEQQSLEGAHTSLLSVTVVLKNEGEQNLRVELGPSALIIARIIHDEEGGRRFEVQRFEPIYFVRDSGEPRPLPYRILRIGQTRQMALALLPVSEPGSYIIQFSAVYSREPFDGETPTGDPPARIDAIEQTIYSARCEST